MVVKPHSFDKNVTGTAHSFDDLRLGGLSFNFSAQPGYPDIDATVEGIPVSIMRQV